MSQSRSEKIESTWGTFVSQQAAETARSQIQTAGVQPDKITLETEDARSPVKLENTGAIANLKPGAISGAVLGALVGLSISLVMTNFTGIGFSALQNFQVIHYFAPIMGAIVGAVGIGLISGLSGASIRQPKAELDNRYESKRYTVVVKGNTEEINLAKKIIDRQGGVIEEAARR